jgi:hypothetical protein
MPEMDAKFNSQVAKGLITLLAGVFMAGSAQAASLACSVKAGPLSLTGVSLIEGPPTERGFLVPDKTVTSKDGLTSHWTLARSKRGYWLRCEYGTRGLDLKLPDSVRQCSVRYDKARRVVMDGQQPRCR